MTLISKLALASAVMAFGSFAQANDATSSVCQDKAIKAALFSTDLVGQNQSITDIMDTGSAIIISVQTEHFVSATNPSGAADVTVYVNERQNGDCNTGAVDVAIFDTNG